METANNALPAVQHFAEVARNYCAWVEGPLGESQEEMHRARYLLADLHLAAVQLPDMGIGKDLEVPDISPGELSRVCHKFNSLPVTTYLDIFNPLKDSEPVTNSLSDDLSDIYGDVRRGLILFDSQHLIEAAWEWRFHFQIHWGQHLVGAQRAIHEYLAEEGF